MLSEITKLGPDQNFKTDLIDVRDFRISATDNTQKSPAAIALAEKISIADRFVVVSPEHNHGYPEKLKMIRYALRTICQKNRRFLQYPWGENRIIE
jgi:NAD(P)H-dependent FMN reductase